MESQKPEFGILELLGHKRLAGRVSEEQRFGGVVGRIDIPNAEGGYSTQFFSAASIYRLSIVTEDVARAVALSCHPEPVHSWELPKQLPVKQELIGGLYDPSGEAADDIRRADGEHGTYTGGLEIDDDDSDIGDEDLPRF